MRHCAYIGIGSNQGTKLENCEKALELIALLPQTELTARSSFFVTEPWGRSREWYINGAAAVDTDLEPLPLLRRCHDIERSMGRRRSEKQWEDRIIDLDLLFFDDLEIDHPFVKIPHPELHRRKFVLLPMCEIAPDLVHPVFKTDMRQLLARAEDGKQVYPISQNDLRPCPG